jgi:chitodextrinase
MCDDHLGIGTFRRSGGAASARGLLARAGVLAGTALILSGTAAPAARASTTGITLSGNEFLLNGQPFVPHGFNSIALLNSSWCSTSQTAAAANNFTSTELATAMSSWNANTLRFQVSQPVLAGPDGAAYAQQIQAGVGTALAAGFVVIVSMQDQSPACGPAEPLPSQETQDAWATLIGNTTLGSNPYVMFELFNEPQNSPVTSVTTNPQQETWPDWLSGGRQIEPSATQTWAPYTPVGHQELVDYLRSTLNVTNVLIADGASFAENLAGVPLLSDPGTSYQIAYAVHPYIYTSGQSDWAARWGYLAGSYALIATEWDYQGSACGLTQQKLAPAFLNYMRSSVNVGVLGQALDVFSGRLMADTSLDPTQCGTASPGSGDDFRNDYLGTFPSPGATAPTVPVILGSPQQTATSITLTWTAAYDSAYGSAELSYAVNRDGQLAGTVPAGTTSFTDTGLSPGTAYTYTVTAADPAGNTSQPSAAFTQATPTCPPPPAPTGLAATAESGTTVGLSWNAVTAPGAGCSVASYLVERGGVVIAEPGGTTYTDSLAASSTRYTNDVLAVATGGVPGSAAAVMVTTPKVADTTPPSPATNLTATAESSSVVVLTWSPGSDPQSGVKWYVIRRNGTRVATVPATSTAFTDTGLSAGTSYSYKVVTINGARLTAASTAVKVTTP